ncbi:MAG: cellulase N-terminal Ig-like domain-containing protein, partial [Bacteroidales bacterium]
MKKQSFLLFLCLFLWFFSMILQAKPHLKEIRTASNRVLVAFFSSDTLWADEVNTADETLWRLNGKPVEALHKFVTEADLCNHHIYLQMPGLKNGQRYHLETPYGDTLFVFDERKILCESIKVNQVGYSALSKVRYANLSIWLGTGGVRRLDIALPEYAVYHDVSGQEICRGILSEKGADESSGDYVYRIDLSGVPEGGPYRISVKGFGVSYPFGVGGNFSKQLGYVSFR